MSLLSAVHLYRVLHAFATSSTGNKDFVFYTAGFVIVTLLIEVGERLKLSPATRKIYQVSHCRIYPVDIDTTGQKDIARHIAYRVILQVIVAAKSGQGGLEKVPLARCTVLMKSVHLHTDTGLCPLKTYNSLLTSTHRSTRSLGACARTVVLLLLSRQKARRIMQIFRSCGT